MMVQLCLNILIGAAQIALVATGLVLVYLSYPRFFHFAHGAIYTGGAYVAYALMAWGGIPAGVAVAVGILGAVVCGILVELGVYRPLRRRQSPALVLLVASLGLFVLVTNGIALLFGDERKRLSSDIVREGIELIGARATAAQIAIIACGIAIPMLAWTILRVTRAGIMLRSMGCDAGLARALGVDSGRVMICAMGAASALGGLAGILVGYDTGLNPAMGFRAVLLAVVAHVIGGGFSIPGVLVASAFIATVQNVSALVLPTVWQDAIIFAVFGLFLLVRPQGLLGHPLRKAGV